MSTSPRHIAATSLEKEFGYHPGSCVPCTGGGSYKYSNIVKELLGINIDIVDEMKSIVTGVDFLIRTSTNEIFSWEKKPGKEKPERVFVEDVKNVFNYFHFILFQLKIST